MLSKIRILFILPLILLAAGTAYAQDPRPQHSERFWRGEYYDNMNLHGMPALVRADLAIDFNWGTGSPDPAVPVDRFSVRWTRTLNFDPGEYEFTATADDGVRLWVNDHLLIDQWREQPATTYMGRMYVSGPTRVKMEYFENGGEAVARLFITPVHGRPTPTPPPPPPPNPTTIIVDDEGAGFVKAGDARFWRSSGDGYSGHMTWTMNNDRVRPNYNWARWYPKLAAARYEVFVHIPARNATTHQARYWVSHYDGFTLKIVDQGATSGWVSLGTYRFRGSSRDYVSLADVTFEPHLSKQVGFDAVKWVRR